jgi:hypothetical protein
MTTLAHIRSMRLEAGTLARFCHPGLSWDDIRGSFADGRSEGWWRHALADAEDRLLLAWVRDESRWRLTPAGRAVTRGVS